MTTMIGPSVGQANGLASLALPEGHAASISEPLRCSALLRRDLPPPASQEAGPEQDTANRQSGWNAEANLRSWRSMQ